MYSRILILFFILSQFGFAKIDKEKLRSGDDFNYKIQLKNGDLLSGSISDFIFDKDNPQSDSTNGIKFKTEIGIALLSFAQINDITLEENFYRHDSRIFLMPTANPIKNNHYIGNFELLYFQGGFGISDFLSFNFGTSLIPSVPMKYQISEFNGKWTFYNDELPELESGAALAIGANLAFANSNNRLIHVYTSGTFKYSRTQFTANVFYKAGSQDYFTFNLINSTGSFLNNSYFVYFRDKSIGVSLGLDTKLPYKNDIHIIGELWNVNVQDAFNSAMLLGFRLTNTNFSADFGLALFTNPFLVPFTSFTWTPF